MIPFLFRFIPKKCLGIDIGTSFIRVVELSRWGERRKLENYGEVSAQFLYQKPFRTFEKSTLSLSSKNISRAIKGILEEARIKTRQVIFSIPDFCSFFTNFELPPMTSEEIPQAIRYEARLHVPLPLSEVTLDWQIIGGAPSDHKKERLRVLLVAVPNEVINQYREIAKISELQIVSLEAEVFGLVRSLIGEDEKRTISLIDIGAQSTTCSIIDKRVLKSSHSFDLAGNELTERISKSLGVDYKIAEDFKREYGILSEKMLDLKEGYQSSTSGSQTAVSGDRIQLGEPISLREILLPLIDSILREAEKIFRDFYQIETKEIQKIIIAGGASFLPGLKEYFQEYFRKEVEIANPFSHIFFSPVLENTLKEMGPSYAIAVGMALGGLE